MDDSIYTFGILSRKWKGLQGLLKRAPKGPIIEAHEPKMIAAIIVIALILLGRRALRSLQAKRETTPSYIGEAARTTVELREMKEKSSELIKSREEAVSSDE